MADEESGSRRRIWQCTNSNCKDTTPCFQRNFFQFIPSPTDDDAKLASKRQDLNSKFIRRRTNKLTTSLLRGGTHSNTLSDFRFLLNVIICQYLCLCWPRSDEFSLVESRNEKLGTEIDGDESKATTKRDNRELER